MATVKFQSWMTYFACIFAFLCITEIHDSFLRKVLLSKEENSGNSQNHRSNRHSRHNRVHYEDSDDIECDARPCLYELIFCGAFRNCLFLQDSANEAEAQRKRSKCSVLTFATLTFVFGFLMVVSHYEFFSSVSAAF